MTQIPLEKVYMTLLAAAAPVPHSYYCPLPIAKLA